MTNTIGSTPEDAARRAQDYPPQPVPQPQKLARAGDPQWMKNAERPVADADGAAIASLIMAVVIPPLGIILGWIAISQAQRKGLRQSGAASWGLILGMLFTVAGIIAAIALYTAAHKAGGCGPSNAAYPYC